MLGTWFLTVCVGLASVLQGGLNRQLGQSLPLATAVFVNGTMFFLAAGIYLWFHRQSGSLHFSALPSWAFLPGLLGFAFVVAVPYAIAKMGALSVFVALVAAQIVGSMAWDWWVEGIRLSGTRILGAALALAGAMLMIKQN